MKTPSPWWQCRRMLCLLVIGAGCSSIALGAPPQQQEEEPNVLRRVGNFLFKKTRQLEKSQDPGKPVPPPRGVSSSRSSTAPPTSGRGRSLDAPPPGAGNPGYYGPASSTGGTTTGASTTGTGRKRGETQYLDNNGSGSGASTTKPKKTEGEGDEKPVKNEAPAEPQGPPAPLSYATPVLGRPGFVYPPGAERVEGNMLDVRGLNPGQKAKDPRTGSMFLVP